MRSLSSFVLLLCVLLPCVCFAQTRPADPEQAIDRFVNRERTFVSSMRNYTPMVETYLQELEEHRYLQTVPSADRYFLGRLRVEQNLGEHFFMTGDKAITGKFKAQRTYAAELSPIGFSSMIFVDRDGFDRQHYDFKFLHREFIGEVRCLVYDASPKPEVKGRKEVAKSRFQGRIWVEDEDFNIIRFNGTYGAFHLDSWRVNLKPGLWLPAYVYSEETDLKYGKGKHLRFKAQTRLWGYNLSVSERQEELTQVLLDPQSKVRDSGDMEDVSPLEAQRAWERRAEDNILEKLEQAGVLAPPGEVDKILQTVVNNLEVTNDVTLEPEVRCRVLLTSPFEATNVGHTILISRGLLDVLPDEASLAMVLAHALGHIVKNHELDAKYAFNDRTQFADEESFRELDLRFTPAQEGEADETALKMLRNSPYKDKLTASGLFLKTLADFAPRIPNLMAANLGNSLVVGKISWLPKLADEAPPIAYESITQIAALPLGSRIKLDPWSNQVKLVKARPARVLQPEDKLLFGLTPFFPYVARYKSEAPAAERAAGQ